MKNNNLKNQQDGSSTFYHASGDNQAEIDYILKNNSAVSISDSTRVDGTHPLNVSDHVTVSTTLSISSNIINRKEVYLPRPNWDDCDVQIYVDSIQRQICEKYTETQDQELALCFIKDTLDRAAQVSIPKYIPGKVVKKNMKKAFSQDIKIAVKGSKKAWWEWKLVGSPSSLSHPLTIKMKQAKRKLRSEQRKAAAIKHQNELDQIMHAKSNDDKMFFKLINRQRSTSNSNTNCLIVDGEKLTGEEIIDGWATHFQKLATPHLNTKYDDQYLQQAKEFVDEIQTSLESRSCEIQPTTGDEVLNAINKMKNNKAPDALGLTAEHFKLGGAHLLHVLTNFFNLILSQKCVLQKLKCGVITPVFKKGDNKVPDNYRGITVTPVLLKILEHILSSRHDPVLTSSQSGLQSGFTRDKSSIMSALLITECQLEAKATKQKIILTTLDTRKAFDVVDHSILLQNLFLDGIQSPEWLILKDLYDQMTSVVKWDGRSSDDIQIMQGVRQGGVLSTQHYKRYNNPLLLDLEEKFNGAKIGNICIPHTTCADDLALLSHSTSEMSLMLNTVDKYSKTHRYDINPTKSATIVYNARPADPTPTLLLDDDVIPDVSSTTHLGIVRTKKGNLDVQTKIASGRKAAYALLGAGLHGRSGMKQDIKAQIWRIFVTPRLVYGLEVLYCNKSDIKKLESFQSKMIKQIQHLPDRTANSATHALLGIPPVETQIHKNLLNLFYNVLKNPDSMECKVATRQLAVKTIDDKSLFSFARQLLLYYQLPTAYELLQSLPSKLLWKKMLNDAISTDVEQKWQKDIKEKPSLRYLNPEAVKVGTAHHIYSSVRPNKQDIQKAEVKAKVLTGTYILQANRSAFNQHAIDPQCRICNQEPETREHFISSCTNTDDIRKNCRKKIRDVLLQYPDVDPDVLLYQPQTFTQVILDCTHPDGIQSRLQEHDVDVIEAISREYIMRLHLSRCRQLAKLALDTG